MRRIAAVLAAGALVASLPLRTEAQAAAGAGSPGCGASSLGERGEAVDVNLLTDPRGQVIGATSTWDPPQSGDRATGDLKRPDIGLTIQFTQASEAAIGRPFKAVVTVALFEPLRSKARPQALAARLAQYRAHYRSNGGDWTALALAPASPDLSLPGSAEGTATFALPAAAQAIEIRVTDQRGKVAAATTFDLQQTAARDALFREAWSAAKIALQTPGVCGPAED